MELNRIKLGIIRQISLSARKLIAAINNFTSSKLQHFLNTDSVETKHLNEQDKTTMLKIESYRNLAFEFVRGIQNR